MRVKAHIHMHHKDTAVTSYQWSLCGSVICTAPYLNHYPQKSITKDHGKVTCPKCLSLIQSPPETAKDLNTFPCSEKDLAEVKAELKDYYTGSELATMWEVTQKQIKAWADSGELKRFRKNKKAFYTAEDVARFMLERGLVSSQQELTHS